MMTAQQAVAQLAEELAGENLNSDVLISRDSKAVIFLPKDRESADEDGEEEIKIEIKGPDCRLFFANTDTVNRLMEALDYPEKASLFLINLTVMQDVLDELAYHFETVDEG